MTRTDSQTSMCPCGSSLAYPDCCGRWHAGAPAPSPEALMRSRYSAFVQLNSQYLLDTWHPRTRPRTIEFNANQKWLGLRILGARIQEDDTGQVEFVARYRIGGASAR